MSFPQNSSLPPAAIWRSLSVLAFTLFALSAYLATSRSETYVSPTTSILIYASALYYLALSIIALISRRYYWAVLPMIILSVPNAVNDLLPSVLMGPFNLTIAPPAFPLFTHIDLFLILGLFRYGTFSLSRRLVATVLIALLTSVFVLSNYLTGAWLTDGIYGLYQLRYALLLYLAFSQIGFTSANRLFVSGLIMAIGITLIETIAHTYVTSPPGHLLSGNLGKNPLGHVGAAMLCFFIFFDSPNKSFSFKFIPLSIAAILMLGSGTRFSILSAFSAAVLTYLLRSKMSARRLFYTFGAVIVGLAILSTTPQGASIAEGIARISESASSPEHIERTAESSSMVTRLHVWLGTIEMVSAHWSVGVGPGNWSFLKSDFNIPYDGLLDPHNDFLNFIVSYGTFLGVLLYLAILATPLLAARRAAFENGDNLLQGSFAFVLCITITGLTNATLWKHSVFALTCTFSLILLFHSRERFSK